MYHRQTGSYALPGEDDEISDLFRLSQLWISQQFFGTNHKVQEPFSHDTSIPQLLSFYPQHGRTLNYIPPHIPIEVKNP
jgi:hypothetical protein